MSLLFVGQPYSNPDGSVYTHNPNLPLPNGQPPTSMYQTSEGWTHNSVTFYISVLLFMVLWKKSVGEFCDLWLYMINKSTHILNVSIYIWYKLMYV